MFNRGGLSGIAGRENLAGIAAWKNVPSEANFEITLYAARGNI